MSGFAMRTRNKEQFQGVVVVVVVVHDLERIWSSNPSGKYSYERPTRGTVCGTMRSMCGADAGCLAINHKFDLDRAVSALHRKMDSGKDQARTRLEDSGEEEARPESGKGN